MKWYLLAFLYGVLLTAAIVSACNHFLTSQADLAFLLMQGGVVVAWLLISLVTGLMARNHHGTSGALGAGIMGFLATVGISFIIPLLVLVFHGIWVFITIGAALLAVIALLLMMIL